MNEFNKEPNYYTCWVKVNAELRDLIAKLGTWYNPAHRGLVRIEGMAGATKEETTLRAMRMLGALGCDLLIQGHATVKGDGDIDCIKRALTVAY